MNDTRLVPPGRHARTLVVSLALLSSLLSLSCQDELSAPEESLSRQESPIVLAPGQVVVSLTLDDNRASQADAALLLEARGMRGTFYVNSGRIGMAGYLTYAQLQRIQAAGHEVGGHTISHPRLTTLDVASQRNQICDDRVTLMNAGLRITSFAYPFGDQDATTRQLVIGCNYNSARETGGLSTPDGCTSCSAAESVFISFLDWLASRGTLVATVDSIIGGTLKPPVSGSPVDGGTPDPVQLVKNPSLETDTNKDGVPDCWQRGGFGTNSFRWTRTTDAHSGSWAQRLTITSYSSGDRKLISTQDLGMCAPALTPGHRYRVSA